MTQIAMMAAESADAMLRSIPDRMCITPKGIEQEILITFSASSRHCGCLST
jgi:hypothetical protein